MKANFLLIFLLLQLCLQAQNLELSTNMTSSLHFPSRILHVDRGSRDVLAEPVPGDDHILLLKAGLQRFAPTNLTVILLDGSVYTFGVRYADSVAQWSFELADKKHPSLETLSYNLMYNTPVAHGMRSLSWDMHARVSGIYCKDHCMYYQLLLDNRSPVEYEIDFMRFFISGRRQAKRVAVQETAIKPLFTAGEQTTIAANQQSSQVIVFDRFTIPDAKLFFIEIHEKNGGRHLLIRVRNRHIMKAALLP